MSAVRERRTAPTNGAARLALVLCVASALSRTVEASTTLAAVGEACSSDADCYDTNANWCHADTNLCAVHSEWGERCVTNDHCKDYKACLGGYCCDMINADWVDASYQRCTACVAKTAASDNFRIYGECTACKADAWLDVSGTQSQIDDRANYQMGWEGVVADFRKCKQTCTADQYQSWDSCSTKKSAGESCGSEPGGGSSESERCASGLCGGNYCCDADAASDCCNLCNQGTGQCVGSKGCDNTTSPAPSTNSTSSNSTSSNSTDVGVSPPPPSASPPPPTGGSAADKKPEGNSEVAKEKKEKAQKTRDTMLNGVTDAKLKKKAKLLADAAISGKKVRKMSAKLTAPDEDTACSDYYSKAGISSSLGACIATATSRRRSLASTTYDVSVFFSEAEVDDSTLTEAENSLKAEGVTGVETSDPIDPITELGTIDGVDSGTLETFKTEASAAAATMPPSPPPPPISPPPPGPPVPNLVQDDDDHAANTRSLVPLLVISTLHILLS